jgi:hypothetical protein
VNTDWETFEFALCLKWTGLVVGIQMSDWTRESCQEELERKITHMRLWTYLS